MNARTHRVAGIDVGGTRKGFHAVALREKQIVATLTTCSAAEAVAWCRRQKVSAVGIDAPCRWSLAGRARPCEGELAALGMSTFATPNQAVGAVHPFYRWMVNGIELFRRIMPYYRLYDGPSSMPGPICFETFPQAIACTLAGKRLSAKTKRMDRRQLLERAGVATDSLKRIDDIDAALCALSAEHVLSGTFKAYGDVHEGFILLPQRCHQ